MPDVLYLDWETRSPVDLKTAGLHNYVSDPRTEILCGAYAINDEPVTLWRPGDSIHRDVFEHIEGGGIVAAHNIAFDRSVCNHIAVKHGWPRIKIEQCHDTLAMAYAMSLPGSLENAALAVGISTQKDMAGHRLMLAMCKPKRELTGNPDSDCHIYEYRDDEESMKKLMDYCATDLVVERELYKRLRTLSQAEHSLWVLDQTINNRGIYVDQESIKAAIKIVESEQKRLDGEMRRVTEGAVATCSAVSQLTDWLRWKGVAIPSVAKADVLEALGDDNLPREARKALQLRREAGKSSTAKLRAMVESASADQRIRGTMQYHGAGTGRWAGRRIQPHNMPRGNLKPAQVEDALRLLREGKRDEIELVYGPVLDVISSCLRGTITAAPGHEFVCCDFSAIEARVLAWLAGQEDVLEIFRGHGKIYEHAAAGIYGKPMSEITKDERQIGKIAVLALGFGGSIGAFQTMARAYSVSVSDKRADEIKTAWRQAHPKIVRYWYDLERAALDAVRYPGDVFEAGHQPVRFRVRGSFLWCQLPNKRLLCYPYPQIRSDDKWGKDVLTYMAVLDSTARKKAKIYPDDKNAGDWQRIGTYGGKLAENITQAVARDLLKNGLENLAAVYGVAHESEDGTGVVFHVHDEIVVEITITDPTTPEEVSALMVKAPEWANGLPVAAEGWRGVRYRK